MEVLEPSPDRIPRGRRPSGRAVAGPPLRAPARDQAARRSTTRCERIGHLEGYVLDDIVPAVEQWRYRNKLEYSFGTDAAGELICGFHAPGSWEEIVSVADCLLASERGNEAREAVLAWARAQGLRRYDRRTHAGLLRNLVVREGRRTGEISVRLVTAPGRDRRPSFVDAVQCDSLLWTRTDGARRDHGRRAHDARGRRRAASTRSSPGCASRSRPRRSSRRTPRWPSGSTASRGEFAALEGWERLYDLYSGIGTVGPVARRRAPASSGASRSSSRPSPTRSTTRGPTSIEQRALLRRRCAARAARARREGRAPRRRRRRPAARGPVGEGRAPHHRDRRPSASSTSPATRRRSRRTRRSSSRRATRCGACAPVDMFPQTPHIECVAVLERVSG